MAANNFAIGLSFHKSKDTIVRAVATKPPCRYFPTRDAAGFITLPTLDPGDKYTIIQGLSQSNFQINDTDREFRLLGDSGWADGVITGSKVSCSNTGFFMKNTEIPAGQDCPIFLGDYDEGFALIEKARYNKSYELYIEFMKELGQNPNGDWVYDLSAFNCAVMNYNEPKNAEGLTEITFDFMSRGEAIFGRYNSGSTRLTAGGVQTSLLFTAPSSGDRRDASVPADNANAVVVSADATVTYTSDGTVALTNLVLGSPDGAGAYIEVASTGARVPAAVSLASNVLTINPTSNLDAATIHRLVVVDGAVCQLVDGTGAASPTGYKTSLQGFTSTFRTA
jgi:hypothetical protein